MNTIELELVGELMDKWERIARALETIAILSAPLEEEIDLESEDT